jgi:hypothetical protein
VAYRAQVAFAELASTVTMLTFEELVSAATRSALEGVQQALPDRQRQMRSPQEKTGVWVVVMGLFAR